MAAGRCRPVSEQAAAARWRWRRFVFALLGMAQLPKGWRTAASTARGRLLMALVIGIGLQIDIRRLGRTGSASRPLDQPQRRARPRRIRADRDLDDAVPIRPGATPAVAARWRRPAGTHRAGARRCRTPSAPDQVALNHLKRLMATERTYRQEGLTIGVLAVKLRHAGIPAAHADQ